ncbi:acyl carrier protein [Paraburkholderia phenoliruptrix]|uniref:acyl carrier protein n=1 Tax=Paraburkholderia phenoliruptrix TaxID=252970 RepID=UPI0028619235|nr:acyl carrier protein [Paraburkholderia phenoliruptrix]MDR6389176.1 acyl carrier protein [Paraburkholderia phenoliruptrix]
MTQANIEERVKKEVAQQMCLSVEDIRMESNIYSDLGADSLDAVELVMAIEDEFGIKISNDEGEKIATVQQIIECVTAKVAS